MTTVIVTGDSKGIGEGIRNFFLEKNYNVIGVDLHYTDSIPLPKNYIRYESDIKDTCIDLAEVRGDLIIVNNAGVQNRRTDIANNLVGTIDFTERLLEQISHNSNITLKSILFNTSASSLTGFEFPRYAASKAGLNAYMKNVACRLAPDATANAIALGGVYTGLNDPVVNDTVLWNKIMQATPLKKWTYVEEVAQWVYFLTVINTSASGQVFLVDNGEKDLNNTFVWPDFEEEAAKAVSESN